MFDPIINSKLNRLLEGGGYSERKTSENILFDETPAYFSRGVNDLATTDEIPFTEGTVLAITWDGVKYTVKVKLFATDEGDALAAGNLAPYGEKDTGEPFIMMAAVEGGTIGFVDIAAVNENKSVTHNIGIAVLTETETIIPINPKYLPEGGVGYTDKQVLTFDGNISGKTVVTTDVTNTSGIPVQLVRISDTIIDVSKITRIVFSGLDADGNPIESQEITADKYVVEQGSPDGIIINITKDYPISGFPEDFAFVYTMSEDSEGFSKGTYVYYCAAPANVSAWAIWISSIECETIHPIDPKYLPGVCLPVVELTTVATTEGAALTEEESARMDEVAALGVPIVVNTVLSEMKCSLIMQNIGGSFACNLGERNINLTKVGGAWTALAV